MRSLVACLAVAVLLPMALTVAGCDTYADELARGQHAFEASEHERALALFRDLEPDMEHLSLNQRAHYAYLRGMTDFRIGYKAESRHWLSLAAAIEKKSPGSLPEDWTRRMDDALKDLNDAVYTGGIASLSNTPSSSQSTGEGEQGEDDATPAPAAAPAPAKPNDE